MADSNFLRAMQAVILDMDGVLWRGDTPLPGLVPFFDYLAQEHIPFVLATNNSTTTVGSYIKKLARMGVQAAPANIVTSAVATAEYLRHTYGDRPIRVHELGEAGLFEILLQAGYPAVMMDADVVVAGLDRDLTYGKLRLASTLIRNGARFIGTNNDVAFPIPAGWVGPPGALSWLATGTRPTLWAPSGPASARCW
jgi:4-nitrophenyl phosphatase